MSRIAHVGQAQVPVFLAYCAAHRFDHDESFLDEHSLSLFRPGPEEKAVIIVDEDGEVRVQHRSCSSPPTGKWGGRASGSFTRSLATLTTTAPSSKRSCPSKRASRSATSFSPTRPLPRSVSSGTWASSFDRRSWLLGRLLGGSLDPRIPADLLLVPCDRSNGRHVDDWCAVINDAFDGMAGHSTMTPATFAQLQDPSAVFAGGDLLLYEGPRAIGLVSVRKDTDEPAGNQAYLGPVAVIKARQKRGLGRTLPPARALRRRRPGDSHAACSPSTRKTSRRWACTWRRASHAWLSTPAGRSGTARAGLAAGPRGA